MSFSATPTQDQVYQALLAYLTGVLPSGVPIIRGLPNRAAMPSPSPGFVLMQALFENRLFMPVDTYVTTGSSPPTTSSIEQAIELAVQIDCYGAQSGTWAAIISTTFEDAYGFNALGPNCEPLYCNEARMVSLTDEELQYEERWCLDARLEWHPVVTVTQGYADALELTMKDVNVLFPP